MAFLEALGQMGSQLAQGALAARQEKSAQAQQQFDNQEKLRQLALQARQLGQTDTAQKLEQARFNAQQEAAQAGVWSRISAGKNGVVLMNNRTNQTVQVPIPAGYGADSKLIFKPSSEVTEGPDGKKITVNYMDAYDPNDPAGTPVSHVEIGRSVTIAPQALATAPTVSTTQSVDPVNGLVTTSKRTTQRGGASASAPAAPNPGGSPTPAGSAYIQGLADRVASGAMPKADVPAKYRAAVDAAIAAKTGPIYDRFANAAQLAKNMPGNDAFTSALLGIAADLAKVTGKSGPTLTALLKAVQTPAGGLIPGSTGRARVKAIDDLIGYLASPAAASPNGGGATSLLYGGGA